MIGDESNDEEAEVCRGGELGIRANEDEDADTDEKGGEEWQVSRRWSL